MVLRPAAIEVDRCGEIRVVASNVRDQLECKQALNRLPPEHAVLDTSKTNVARIPCVLMSEILLCADAPDPAAANALQRYRALALATFATYTVLGERESDRCADFEVVEFLFIEERVLAQRLQLKAPVDPR